MSELNLNNAEINSEVPAKAKAEPTTAKHARFLAELAQKRADKFTEQADEARAEAVRYTELASTLPESHAPTPKARPVVEIGTVVSFRFGRTTATSKAQVLQGVVKARKEEDGKVKAYKLVVGEGFDEAFYTVQPGAILLAGESAEENEASDGQDAPTQDANQGGVTAFL